MVVTKRNKLQYLMIALIVVFRYEFVLSVFIVPSRSVRSSNSISVGKVTPLCSSPVDSSESDDRCNPDLAVDQSTKGLEGSKLKANRFSKFAPDANLPTEEFRRQLRENMKADLEERRRNDPNRGNQPAKNYLDGL